MSGQLTTTALLIEFLDEQDGEWFTLDEATKNTALSRSAIHRDLQSLVEIDRIDVREREEPNTAGPNPHEYRFVV